MSVASYSNCHFAEIMYDEFNACSYCGESCHPIPMAHTLTHDIELTLRRWKDGDCTLDEMFDRVNKEFERTWQEIFEVAKEQLQTGKPKYEYRIDQMDWTPIKERNI